jgi:ABC-type bacteriocin/lantibiotic exporter with double-glycine peptidase domain
MNNYGEPQNNGPEQGARDPMPDQYGNKTTLRQFMQPAPEKKTTLRQFMQPVPMQSVKAVNLPPTYTQNSLPNNGVGAGTESARQPGQAPSQISFTLMDTNQQNQVMGGFVQSNSSTTGSSAPASAKMATPAEMAAAVKMATPAKMAMPASLPQGNQAMMMEEEFEDPFASPNNALLSLLALPFRALGVIFQPRRSLPALTQMAATECGAASLAMILSYYGHHISISEVSTQCGVGRDGLSASSIVKAARQYGLNARAISVHDIDKFEDLDLPAIIHWQFNHFMVVERWNPKEVTVADPAVGRKKLTRDEFDKGFTGIVILLEPGEHFAKKQKGGSSRALLLQYLQNGLRLAPGATLQILLASLVMLLFGLIMPGTTAIVINSIVPQSLSEALPVFALGMGLLVLSEITLSYLRSMILMKLQSKIDTHLMVSFFDHLLSLPLRYFQLRSSGDILTRLESNAVLRDTLNTQLIGTILDTVSLVVYLGILLKLAPMIALVTLAFGSIQIMLMVGTTKPMLAMLRTSLEAQGRSQGYLTEALMQITTLKAAGAEKHVRLRWLRLFFAEMSTSVKRGRFVALIGSIQSMVQACGPLVLMLIGAQQVIAGSVPLGTMLALNSLASSFLNPLISLVSTGLSIQQAQAHLDRIVDVMKAEPEQRKIAVAKTPRLKGHVRLANVSFQYDLNSKPVLRDINLTIQPGQKVAIVGRSGSGKSTLGKLLLGLYLPTQGEIYYDDVPLSSMSLQEVRAQLGVVMQDIGLFNGSIRENIAFNLPGIDLEAVVWAAQAAAIHEDIVKMPMDYETIVSEGGNAISGGQRQRLALARALVRNPAILLLDEATSSLDVVTERVVERNLRQLSCTQIIIAHRLSTVRNADIILAVDQGTLVEQGTHDELLQKNGFYSTLIKSQMESGDIDGHS